MPIESAADQLTETSLDLQAAFDKAQGHLVVVVKPERSGLPGLLGPSAPEPGRRGLGPAHRNRVGRLHRCRPDGRLGQLSAHRSAAGRVTLYLWPAGATATTGADGTATLPLPAGRAAQLLVAKSGDQTAILPANLYYWGDEGWKQQPLTDVLQWYVFDDRKMYRPGEEVHVKGWIRRWAPARAETSLRSAERPRPSAIASRIPRATRWRPAARRSTHWAASISPLSCRGDEPRLCLPAARCDRRQRRTIARGATSSRCRSSAVPSSRSR